LCGHSYLAERGALSWSVPVGLGVLVTFCAVAVPGENNNTLDSGHLASRRLVVEKVVGSVGGSSRSGGWLHGGREWLKYWVDSRKTILHLKQNGRGTRRQPRCAS